ncbi:MAG TPA: LuxR C-terminal-related transcriptional regulator [Puia sp.]|jgi:DNA-binding CsgD family transcriptional regulator|nr:LuxR C-terminal-related transcriptional regulator [Puia sp.]
MPEPFDIAKKIWETYSAEQAFAGDKKNNLVLDLSQRLIHFFQAGEFYVYLFNVSTLEMEYMSQGVEKVLGYRPEEMTIDSLFDKIHPEDQPIFLNYENELGKFLLSLPKEKIFKYKVRVDLRMRKIDGTYTRILHQAMVFDIGEDGKLLRSLGVHTDIGYLKVEGKPTLSFVGLEGEPSYINVQVGQQLIPLKETLSKREKEVLLLIMEGMQSKAIADKLHVSKQTVDTHRKNMLVRTDSRSSAELITKAIRNGWV